MKKISYSMIMVSVVLILIGAFSSFIMGIKKDKEETYKRLRKVTDIFTVFENNTSSFESYRDELYNTTLNNMYYDTMSTNDTNIKNMLSNYENLVDSLAKNTNDLNYLCEDIYYPDSNTNNKCNNYKSIYEQVNNYFITDINIYNDMVKKYNEYQKSINSDLIINEYKTNKNYIDYNNDKKIEGKEE